MILFNKRLTATIKIICSANGKAYIDNFFADLYVLND